MEKEFYFGQTGRSFTATSTKTKLQGFVCSPTLREGYTKETGEVKIPMGSESTQPPTAHPSKLSGNMDSPKDLS